LLAQLHGAQDTAFRLPSPGYHGSGRNSLMRYLAFLRAIDVIAVRKLEPKCQVRD
jgi:hypothetical protein